jgi:hypothetical protein
MPLTLEQMVEEVKGAVGDSGTCSYDLAKTYINRARRLLWDKREWNATCEYVCLCCVDSCFTLPPRYAQIKAAWVNNQAASLADEWFNLTPNAQFVWQNSCHRQIIEVGGKHVVFRDYRTRPYQITVVTENIADEGVEISFEAYNEYSSYEQITVLTGKQGELSKSQQAISGIRSVSKPKTKGRIRVYAYDPVLEITTLISIYQPSDVNPSWRRFKAPRGCNCITLYAAKNYVDLDDPLELVEFTPEAMYFAVLALNNKENRNGQGYIQNLGIAIAEEEKAMESDTIPTAAPLRIMDFDRADSLIYADLLSPNANDYFMRP